LNGIEDGALLLRPFVLCRARDRATTTETDFTLPFCSSIWRQSIRRAVPSGKSQSAGLRLLKNFAELG
jgi:hypothetical protein